MSLQYPTIRIHPSGMQFAADNVGGMLVMLALFGVAGYDGLVTEQMKIWLLVAAFLTFAWLVYKYVYVTRMTYVITEEQLKYDYGIFACQRDFIELYRVVDYSEQRTFLQMMFGLKTISIYSGDRTNPRLDLIGIDDNRDLISEIRRRVEFNKTRRNIHEFTNTK